MSGHPILKATIDIRAIPIFLRARLGQVDFLQSDRHQHANLNAIHQHGVQIHGRRRNRFDDHQSALIVAGPQGAVVIFRVVFFYHQEHLTQRLLIKFGWVFQHKCLLGCQISFELNRFGCHQAWDQHHA